jgi:hypothetical protein
MDEPESVWLLRLVLSSLAGCAKIMHDRASLGDRRESCRRPDTLRNEFTVRGGDRTRGTRDTGMSTGRCCQPGGKRATSGNCALFAMSGERNRYKEAKLGVIEPGAWADLLLVDGNPTKDIQLLGDPERNLVVIIKNGTLYKNALR